jgi:hypothetical protein
VRGEVAKPRRHWRRDSGRWRWLGRRLLRLTHEQLGDHVDQIELGMHDASFGLDLDHHGLGLRLAEVDARGGDLDVADLALHGLDERGLLAAGRAGVHQGALDVALPLVKGADAELGLRLAFRRLLGLSITDPTLIALVLVAVLERPLGVGLPLLPDPLVALCLGLVFALAHGVLYCDSGRSATRASCRRQPRA